jgi:hypothetical protein
MELGVKVPSVDQIKSIATVANKANLTEKIKTSLIYQVRRYMSALFSRLSYIPFLYD